MMDKAVIHGIPDILPDPTFKFLLGILGHSQLDEI